MPIKSDRKPKVQRGLSMTVELFDAIQSDADRFGLSWNEAAERALNRVFLAPLDLQKKAGNMRGSQPDEKVTFDG